MIHCDLDFRFSSYTELSPALRVRCVVHLQSSCEIFCEKVL
uniref:Uncharacterized protein n=1 Tax=Anguilla anguilla TaxID=7936 RepID=A0A0E9Q8A0_ANGAN